MRYSGWIPFWLHDELSREGREAGNEVSVRVASTVTRCCWGRASSPPTARGFGGSPGGRTRNRCPAVTPALANAQFWLANVGLPGMLAGSVLPVGTPEPGSS